jgi:hypothetical protein
MLELELKDGGWELTAASWKLEAGGWKLAAGSWFYSASARAARTTGTSGSAACHILRSSA